MDEDFFKDLNHKREEGSVDDENLDKMLETHLDKVDDFKKRKEREARAFQKKIERELMRKRREREDGREEQKKLREQVSCSYDFL